MAVNVSLVSGFDSETGKVFCNLVFHALGGRIHRGLKGCLNFLKPSLDKFRRYRGMVKKIDAAPCHVMQTS
jgi:hypothetical protein